MNKTLIALIILTTPFPIIGWFVWGGTGDRSYFSLIAPVIVVPMAYTSAFAWASGATAADNIAYTLGIGALVAFGVAYEAMRSAFYSRLVAKAQRRPDQVEP